MLIVNTFLNCVDCVNDARYMLQHVPVFLIF